MKKNIFLNVLITSFLYHLNFHLEKILKEYLNIMSEIISRIIFKIQNSDEKSKNIILNITGAFFIRGLALIISLFTLPAYIQYFNNDEILGVWFTILSVLSWVLAFDLGIGNGLRNRLVLTFIKKDYLSSKKYISSAYFMISIVVFITLLLSAWGFRFVNWNVLFNIPMDKIPRETLYLTILIVFSGIMLQFLFRLINSILYALQKSALNNLLSLFTSLLIFFYVSTSNPGNLTYNLLLLAVIHVLAVNMPLLIATILIFRNSLSQCRPNIKYFKIKYLKDVFLLGGMFFWVQVMYMLLSVTNEFFISWLTEPENVVDYQIYNKIFTIIGIIFTLALTPIWSAVTKAMAENDFIWIKKLYKKLVYAALLTSISQFLLIPFLPLIINFWLGDTNFDIDYKYACIFAISSCLFIWIGVLSTITNGFGLLKIQSTFYTLGVILKIPLAWYFVQVFDSWIGVIIANILALSLFCIIQPIWIKNYIDNKIIGDEHIV